MVAPIAFGPRPIPSQVRVGAGIFQRREDPDKVWMQDRESIGLWFDGKHKRSVEELTWLSPMAVSRRLGYLQAQEGWTDEELVARWKEAGRFFGAGKLSFVVRLCAYPRTDLINGETEPSVPTLQPLVCVERTSATPQPIEQTLLEERSGSDPVSASGHWIAHPAFQPLQGVLDRYDDPGYLTGPFRTRMLLLTCPATPTPLGRIEIVLSTPGKQRRASLVVIRRTHRRSTR